jgi:hypothetical protein
MSVLALGAEPVKPFETVFPKDLPFPPENYDVRPSE